VTKLPYFAYGLNMLTRRLRMPERAPSAAPVGIGYVEGRTLTFSKISNDESGECDAEDSTFTNPDARVHGVLFELADAERQALRAAEKGYKETDVEVITNDKTVPAFTYVAASRAETALQPYHWYKAIVMAGAREHGLPGEYIEQIRASPSKHDPDPLRRVKNEWVLIADLLQYAISRVGRQRATGLSTAKLHNQRSRDFVEAFAERLRLPFLESSTVVVFSEGYKGNRYKENRPRFKQRELLYDVLMCDTATTKAAITKNELTFITRAFWAIESEFDRDSRESMYDFNKLILSSAEAKLFIGPLLRDSDPAAILRPLRDAAAHCSGELLAALVPHPSLWQPKVVQPVQLWWWQRGDCDWQVLPTSKLGQAS